MLPLWNTQSHNDLVRSGLGSFDIYSIVHNVCTQPVVSIDVVISLFPREFIGMIHL